MKKKFLPWITAALMLLYSKVGTALYPTGKEKVKLERIEHFIVYYMNAERKRSYLTEGLNRIYGRLDEYLPVFKKYEKGFAKFNANLEDLCLLAIAHEFVESEGNPRAVSPVGAKGCRQFMDKTAKMYGLKINKYINEAYDPVKSTDAALRYILNLANRFNSIDYALMAYNYSSYKVKRLAKKKYFWDIKENEIPKEAYDFVPKIYAIMTILNNKDYYKLKIAPKKTKTRIYKVKKGETLSSIAKKFNVSIEKIREYNIFRDRNNIPAGFRLKIPIKS